jgi:putative oxidoreductase
MERVLGGFAGEIHSILRFVAGILFACHGAQKLFGALGGTVQPAGSLPWLAGVIELVAGVLIAIGFFTSFAAFIASGEMAFAYFMVHAPKAPWPILNGGELAVLYCFLFLYMAARGSGPWSLDRMIRRKT